MKKLIYACSVLALLFTSCSSDSDSPATTDGTLVKKIIDTDPIGDVMTTNFTYSGNKIVSAIDDTEETDMYFTYTGDDITKLEYKLNDGTVDQVDNYSYDSTGRLISMISIEPTIDWGSKEVYTYNTDGTVSVSYYSGDELSQTNLDGTGKIYFTNGEVSKIERYDGADLEDTTTYTYDTKNNFMKNVTGYSKINFAFSTADGVNHNIISENSTLNGLWSYSFVYNDNGFPSSSTETYSGDVSTSVYFYE
ncbi:hypothetical protein [Flavobacterium sp.]|uniref:hypothetical protein n=1 Tax=Flavobacterium sp. TaxID=239 RepID=UPI0026261D45|nr:hypothetical protein [Flavobacterium sp.]